MQRRTKTGGSFLTNKKLAETAVLASLAIVLGYIETLIPIPIPIPGIKLGISNLAIMLVLFRIGKKSAFGVMLIKVTVSSVLFSGFTAFAYSLCGGLLSLAVMCLLKNVLSVKFVSAAGGIAHNLGQLFAACAVLKDWSVMVFIPYLLISGLITGVLIGVVCELFLRHVIKS